MLCHQSSVVSLPFLCLKTFCCCCNSRFLTVLSALHQSYIVLFPPPGVLHEFLPPCVVGDTTNISSWGCRGTDKPSTLQSPPTEGALRQHIGSSQGKQASSHVELREQPHNELFYQRLGLKEAGLCTVSAYLSWIESTFSYDDFSWPDGRTEEN